MQLVREHPDAVFGADVAEALQVLPAPDPPCGIMGAAQDEEGRAGVPRLALEVLEVDLVAPAAQDQGVVGDLGAVVQHRAEEGVIDGPLDNDPVPRLAEGLDGHVRRRDRAGGELNPLPLDPPAVAAGLPVDDRVVAGVGNERVAEDSVPGPLGQRLRDLRRHLEIHIRYPQRERGADGIIHPLDRPGIHVPLGTVRAAPFDDPVEVVSHKKILLSEMECFALRFLI